MIACKIQLICELQIGAVAFNIKHKDCCASGSFDANDVSSRTQR